MLSLHAWVGERQPGAGGDGDNPALVSQFLLIFRKAAAGELQEDSGLHALARLSEIDVSTEGVKGAKSFFEAKVRAGSHSGGRGGGGDLFGRAAVPRRRP